MTTPTQTLYRSYIIEEYHLTQEPYYLPVGDEIELFEAAYEQRIPVIFKGPTGCGKTRFVEYMSYRLGATVDQDRQRREGRERRRAQRERSESSPRDDRLPRGPDGERPRGALPAGGGEDGVDRRTSEQGREGRRNMLPG